MNSPTDAPAAAPALAERLAKLTPQQREALLRKLAERQAAGAAADAAEPAPRAVPGQPMPLTSAQKQMWVFERLQPDTAAYHVYNHYRLFGPLDLDALEQACAALVRRHNAFRIGFDERAGEPTQTIREHCDFSLRRFDLSHLPEDARAAETERLVDAESLRPFDLSRPPLFRVSVLRLAPDIHVLLMVFHHLISDAWSFVLIESELKHYYEMALSGGVEELPEKTLHFGDVVLETQTPEYALRIERQLRYWRDTLAGATGLLDLPADRPRAAVATANGARFSWNLPRELASAVADFVRQQGATSFMAYLAVFQAMLARYSGDQDIVVGTPVANRSRPELEEMVGLFVNTVALRSDLSDDPSFRTLLGRARDTVLHAMENALAPLEKVIEQANPERSPGRPPLIQAMFVMQKHGSGEMRGLLGLDGVWIEPRVDTARFEITLSMGETANGVYALIDYNSDLFLASTIERMAGHYNQLVRDAIARPDLPISQLEMLGESELADLVALADGGPAIASPEPTLFGLFARQAQATADAPALIEPGAEWTYAQALRRANGIGMRLHASGIGRGDYVAVLADRSAEAVLAVLGVLAAGAAYLPLDPGSPDERLRYMLDNAAARAILTPPALRDRAAALASSLPVLRTDELPEADAPPAIERDERDPAYLIFTSGSTGTPKGVVIEHRGAVNLVQGFLARHRFESQRLLMIPPLIFDASVGDVFPVLSCGSALVLHPAPTELGPAELERFCRDYAVTAIDAPAALWRRWTEGWAARAQDDALLPGLNLMMIGGESVPIEQVRRFAAITGRRVTLCNHYGPTEASVCATLLPTVDAAEIADVVDLPIGRPLPGVRVHLLDRHLRPVPRGVAGEVCIAGRGVARGYLGAEELSIDRFVAEPGAPDSQAHDTQARMYRTGDLARWNNDGNLQFIGRRDHQIKLRGFRIELGEIDAALAALPGVQSAATLLREDRPGERRLVAYVVAAGEAADAATLRAGLARRLPDAMLPSAFVVLEQMPLTANGKIDRRALPAPDERMLAQRAIRAPRTATETAMLAVWREVLGRENLSTDDDFFANGGDSLAALPLAHKLREAFGVDLPLSAVFAAPTIVTLSQTIDELRAGGAIAALDIESKVTLPESIDAARVASARAPREAPGSVLLTGATGFLGAYILRDLIDLSAAEVVCLVRADNAADGLRRIRANLESYRLWREGDEARLVPVLGDLGSPRLGLTPEAFAALAQRVDAIVHNGGQVNFLAPYAHLEAANVGGTREVLVLATTAHLKPVQLVSTLGVYLTPRHYGTRVIEAQAPPDGPGQYGGYNQSKWVGEQLALRARERGVPVAIHRPARITGDTDSGISNPGDYFNAWIRGCAQLGKAPRIEGDFFDMTPVDYVAHAVVRILLGAGDANGNYHYFNAHTLPVTEAVAAMRALVGPIEEVDYPQWRQALLDAVAAGEDNALKPFAGMFGEQVQADAEMPVFDCSATEAVVAPFGLHCPPADRGLFERYLRFLQSRGVLAASGAPA